MNCNTCGGIHHAALEAEKVITFECPDCKKPGCTFCIRWGRILPCKKCGITLCQYCLCSENMGGVCRECRKSPVKRKAESLEKAESKKSKIY